MSFILTPGVLQQQANRAGGGVPTDGLISYWKLDGTSGPVVDSWGNNDGTNYGALRGVEGKVGNAFEFDGEGHTETEDVQIIPETGDFTISGWCNLDFGVEEYISFVGGGGKKGRADIIFMANSSGDGVVNKVRFFARNIDIVLLVGPDIRGVGWTMLSVVRKGDEFKLYINDDLYDENTGSGNIGLKIWIGAAPSSSGDARFKMRGKEDEIGIWGRALTDEEIIQLYNDGKGTTL